MRGGKSTASEPIESPNPLLNIDSEIEEYRNIMQDAGIGWLVSDDEQNDAIRTILLQKQGPPKPGAKKAVDVVKSVKPMVPPISTRHGGARPLHDGDDGDSSLPDSPPDSPISSNSSYPLLAISNFAEFVRVVRLNTMFLNEHRDTTNAIAAKLREELGKGDDDVLDIMVVVTAPLHHSLGERLPETRMRSMQAVPMMCVNQTRGFFGDAIEIHVTHFMDPLLEPIAGDPLPGYDAEHSALAYPTDVDVGMLAYFTKQAEIFNRNKPNNEYRTTLGSPYVFNVNDSTAPRELSEKLGRTDAVFFVGGETHWLNRQIKKMKLKQSIHDLNRIDRKIVFCGNSAGLINLGLATSFAAAKRVFDPDGLDGDYIGDLSDKDGNMMVPGTADPYMGSRLLPTTTWSESADSQVPIDYAGLGRRPFVFFPHYTYSWDGTIQECAELHGPFQDEDTRLEPELSIELDVVRITDTMLLLFGTNETHCIFADPRYQKYVHKLASDFDYTVVVKNDYENDKKYLEGSQNEMEDDDAFYALQQNNFALTNKTAVGKEPIQKYEHLFAANTPAATYGGGGGGLCAANVVTIGVLAFLTVVASIFQ